MATIESRITALEQQAPCEVFSAHQLATCTDEELEDIIFACPVFNGSHEKFVLTTSLNPIMRGVTGNE